MYWARDKLHHLQCCPGEAINDQPSAISHVWVENDIQQCVAHLQQAPHIKDCAHSRQPPILWLVTFLLQLAGAGADILSMHSNGWHCDIIDMEFSFRSSRVRLCLRTTCIRRAVGKHHGVRDELALVHEILDLGVALQQRGHGLRALQAPALQNEGRVSPFALQEGPMLGALSL